MKKLVKKGLLSVAALTALSTQTFAASGQTSVSFNFPNIVILHYVGDVKFDVPATVFGPDSVKDATQKVLNGFTAPNLNGDAAVSVTLSTALNGYTGTINNAWAVRAITTNNVQVQITLDTANATNGTSTVTLSNATVDDGTNSGATIQFAPPGLSAANAHYGNVNFNIDFSGVTTNGLHQGAQYTVTATAL